MKNSNLQVSGTYQEGKMYRGNGRWVKILMSKYVTLESRISIGFGYEGEYKAFDLRTFPLEKGYRKSLDESARDFIKTGVVAV